jgi:hypothetical protein
MLSTIQITGFILRLIGIVVLLIDKPTDYFPRIVTNFILATCFTLSLDLKTHSSLGFIIFIVLYSRRWIPALLGLIELAVVHVLIDIHSNQVLELSWLQNLSTLGNPSGEGGESASLWKIFGHLGLDSEIAKYLSATLVLTTIAIGFRLSRKSLTIEVVAMGSLVPALMLYVHYYELIPLIAVAYVLILQNSIFSSLIYATTFFTIPREYLSIKNIFLMAALSLLAAGISLADKIKLNRKSMYVAFAKGLGLLLTTYLINFISTSDYRVTQSLIVSETLLFSIWVISRNFSAKKRKTISGLI